MHTPGLRKSSVKIYACANSGRCGIKFTANVARAVSDAIPEKKWRQHLYLVQCMYNCTLYMYRIGMWNVDGLDGA